jgi:hypothetical protein
MMDDDWRLQGQEKYLRGVALSFRLYTRSSPTWDHDHCEFCGVRFAEAKVDSGAVHEGFATSDGYRWICATCFADFRERFSWQLVETASKS